MALTLIEKIMKSHLISGTMQAGEGIALKIDQTLTQDATGTMAYLQFEALQVPEVQTEVSVSYVDHQLVQVGFENADDHRYLQTVAKKHGIVYSRPGNGICHQVHLERLGKPGKTLLGSDSHTPTAGGIGMLGFGAGGMDVATAMAGLPFQLKMPAIVNVELIGQLRPWVTAKDVILEMLRRLSVKGGVNKAFEYTGPGLNCLSIPARSSITNMGTELGATTSIFPSDEITRQFLKAQGREQDFVELGPDPGAAYADHIVIDLSSLEPLVAQPHMPDLVTEVKHLTGKPIQQIFIGSCTNSSYTDLVKVARILKGKMVHPDIEMGLSPGSRQVFEMAARNGVIADLIQSGVRILEVGCTACAGGGMAPGSEGVSLRTTNRNFKGRSGTADALVYLASSETCAASAIAGTFVTAEEYANEICQVKEPEEFLIDDRMLVQANGANPEVEVFKGPNIQPLPDFYPMDPTIRTRVEIKVGDNITTDHIIPAASHIVKLRSNVPAISQYVLTRVDESFPERIQKAGSGIIVAGSNYGQGSSREHAALSPRFLNVKAILAKSFARIHVQNLANFGILPLEFQNVTDYEQVQQGDELQILNVIHSISNNAFIVQNLSQNTVYKMKHPLTKSQEEIVIAGGLLPYLKERKVSL
ncbi:MAG: aconitate hydratase [Bacillota bacterium]|nr:aconitate hydratase [Bacillota bacterium]